MSEQKTSEEIENILQTLSEFSEAFDEAMADVKDESEAYWNNLSKEDQLKAFCAVSRRIYKGELIDRRSYRGVLYDVFGFGPEAYIPAQMSNYLEIHNALYGDDTLNKMGRVDRIEVIDLDGRAYIKYLNDENRVFYSLQDDDKTLKVFIRSNLSVDKE